MVLIEFFLALLLGTHINVVRLDNLAINNQEELLNLKGDYCSEDSTRAIPPSSKMDNSTVASLTGESKNKKEAGQRLDSSQSATAQAQKLAKGDVEVDSDNEVSSWKSPNLKFRQPLKPVTPSTIIFYLRRKALKYIVISCVICYFFGKLGFGWIAGLASIAGGNIILKCITFLSPYYKLISF
jgi:hypothetical protein